METSEHMCTELDPLSSLIPSRTKLYCLNPIGIGTALVEGIPSYVMRVAEAHRISVRHLAGQILTDLASPLGLLFPAGRAKLCNRDGFRTQPYAISGVVDRVELWIHALECGTGRSDIRLLSMWPFRKVLGERMFSDKKGWCPFCLQMWADNGTTVYEPLLWSFEDASECPVHGCPLVHKCATCNRLLGALAGNSHVGHCSSCGSWLGSSGELVETVSNPSTEGVAAETAEIARLLERIPAIEWSTLADVFRRNLTTYLESVANGNISVMARCMRCDPAVLSFWIIGKFNPHLGNLLRACQHMGISTARLFGVSAPTAQEIEAANNSRVRSESKVMVYPKRMRAELVHCLREALSDPMPMTLRSVAEKLCYTSSEPLYRASRELCRQVSERFRAQSKKPNQARKFGERICDPATLRRTLKESLKSDPIPSLVEIARELGYANERPLKREQPELCALLQKRRSEYRRTQREMEIQILESALCEDPAPCVWEMCKRLGVRNTSVLRRRDPELCSRIDERYRSLKLDTVEGARNLARAALEEVPPPPLRLIQKRLNITTDIVRANFPQIGKQISERYREYRALKALNWRNIHLDSVRAVITELNSEGIYPSSRVVLRRIPEGTRIGRMALIELIREAKADLGISD